MASPNNHNNGLSIDVGDELSKNLTIHTNIKQEVIITTGDKLRLVLMETKEAFIAQRDWWTPFGLLFAFISTLCTADFRNAFGVSKDIWHAAFVLLAISCAIWLFLKLYKFVKNWNLDNIDNIIEKIKVNQEKN